jgi:predicted ArsR family transcriptional regulator
VRHDLNETIVRLCVLDDPARWAAYVAVRTAGRPLTRADVADEVGISARLAAFHLEKLLSEGFLEATYERDELSTGVGHPAKRYRPTSLELEVSIPPRRYDLAAEILAEVLEADSSDLPLESQAQEHRDQAEAGRLEAERQESEAEELAARAKREQLEAEQRRTDAAGRRAEADDLSARADAVDPDLRDNGS